MNVDDDDHDNYDDVVRDLSYLCKFSDTMGRSIEFSALKLWLKCLSMASISSAVTTRHFRHYMTTDRTSAPRFVVVSLP